MSRPSRSSSNGSRSLSERPTYLISDLHLEDGRPDITELFVDFLAGPARSAESLYILGDLFEVWIGDDAPGALGTRIATAVHALAGDGVPVYFMVGNRDFLLGDDYCRRAGMQRITEPWRMPGHDRVLMHGDSLCTDDVAYQRFRRRVREEEWQRRTLGRPIWVRKWLARLARTISRLSNRSKSPDIMDVNEDAVADCFRHHRVSELIHGHTHRPAIHSIEVDGQVRHRLVLGDWHPQRGSVLALRGTKAELFDLARDESGRLIWQTRAELQQNAG